MSHLVLNSQHTLTVVDEYGKKMMSINVDKILKNQEDAEKFNDPQRRLRIEIQEEIYERLRNRIEKARKERESLEDKDTMYDGVWHKINGLVEFEKELEKIMEGKE